MTPHSKRHITSMVDLNHYLLTCGDFISGSFFSIIHISSVPCLILDDALPIHYPLYIYMHLRPPIHQRDPPRPILSHPLPFLIHQFSFASYYPSISPLILPSPIQGSLSWLSLENFQWHVIPSPSKQPKIPHSSSHKVDNSNSTTRKRSHPLIHQQDTTYYHIVP
jgi:hypothetical protein